MPPHDLQIEPVIGLEIHVQLATRTKMWCGCSLEFGAPPNSRVCPVCLGLPGSLPVINARAVDLAVRTGVALNCRIAPFTKWDRKSYYYPDLPKNYQISQYDLPLCANGHFELPFEDRIRKIRIVRAHLEEDAGKNVHDFPGCTGVDLNRAGAPLLEIVTAPDLHSAAETREFAVQLHRLVRYLGVSDANMQMGQMRFEPNINVRIKRDGQTVATPIVEVKNLNSFKALEGAIAYEIERQVEAWQADGLTAVAGNKSNRGWDDVHGRTVLQREKEEANDYRYFPDPDLPPVTPDLDQVRELREHMPELPLPRSARFISEYKLPPRDAPALVDDRATADLLDDAAAAGGDKLILGKQFLSFWSKLANETEGTIAGLGLPPQRLAELANLVRDGRISATAAGQIAEHMARLAAERIANLRSEADDRGVFGHVVHGPGPAVSVVGKQSASGREILRACATVDAAELAPGAIAERLSLVQVGGADEIGAWVEQAIAANAQAVADARTNPKKMQAARGFLTGQVMKLSGGKADPKKVAAAIEARLAAN